MADTRLTDQPIEKIHATEAEPEPTEEAAGTATEEEMPVKEGDQIHG